MTHVADQSFREDDMAPSSRVRSGPLFSGLDVAGIIAAIVMALGPLTAYTAGF